MIAKPLIPFSAMVQDEDLRKSIFHPISGAKAVTLLSDSKQRRSNFDKPKLLKRSKRRLRNVSFASSEERVYDAPESHCEASISDLWFTNFDFQRFLKTAQQEAKTIRIGDDEDYLTGVDQSHSIAIRLAESVNKNIRDETLLNRIFKRLDMKNTGLAKWCLETQHRGLERIASKQLRHAKHFIRRELKNIIRYEEDDTTMSSGRAVFSKKSPEELAHALQLQTKEARLFARMMGLADELAARQVHKEEVEF